MFMASVFSTSCKVKTEWVFQQFTCNKFLLACICCFTRVKHLHDVLSMRISSVFANAGEQSCARPKITIFHIVGGVNTNVEGTI